MVRYMVRLRVLGIRSGCVFYDLAFHPLKRLSNIRRFFSSRPYLGRHKTHQANFRLSNFLMVATK